jgi:nucleotide-binding universal stress UspA family protein
MVSSRITVRRILCPVDLSETSKRALGHARALATWYDAELTVLEVVWAALPPIALPGAAYGGSSEPLLTPTERARFEAELDSFAGEHAGSPRVELRVTEGPVVPTILKTSRDVDAGLIVLGTHGTGGFDRVLLGSITDKILRKATCPVMTIPPSASSAPRGGRYRTIVCAMDFSPAATHALRYALSLAQDTEANVALVHVVEWPDETPDDDERGADRRFREALEARKTQDLLAAVPADARDWCKPEAVITHGRAHEAIVSFAADRGADLIVLGVHGRSALNLAIFGSTANQVIRHATCPVLTVRD